MAIAMPLPSSPRRGVSAPGRGLDPIPPPNREDETLQATVDQAHGAVPPAPTSTRTRAGQCVATDRQFGLAGGMRPLQRRSRQGTGQLRAADSSFHTGIHREDIDQAGDSQDLADLPLRGGQRQVTPAFPGPPQHAD